MSTLLYLAYGSNLHPRWLRNRVPSAEPVRQIYLDGWQLHFNKQSHTDNSAKCNIMQTGNSSDRVHAMVYRFRTAEKHALDAAEGGYDCVDIPVPDMGKVMVYLARPEHIIDGILPYRWYRDIVIAGAKHHALPARYIDRLKTVKTINDPVAAREHRHRAIVRGETG